MELILGLLSRKVGGRTQSLHRCPEIAYAYLATQTLLRMNERAILRGPAFLYPF